MELWKIIKITEKSWNFFLRILWELWLCRRPRCMLISNLHTLQCVSVNVENHLFLSANWSTKIISPKPLHWTAIDIGRETVLFLWWESLYWQDGMFILRRPPRSYTHLERINPLSWYIYQTANPPQRTAGTHVGGYLWVHCQSRQFVVTTPNLLVFFCV